MALISEGDVEDDEEGVALISEGDVEDDEEGVALISEGDVEDDVGNKLEEREGTGKVMDGDIWGKLVVGVNSVGCGKGEVMHRVLERGTSTAPPRNTHDIIVYDHVTVTIALTWSCYGEVHCNVSLPLLSHPARVGGVPIKLISETFAIHERRLSKKCPRSPVYPVHIAHSFLQSTIKSLAA